MPKHSLLALIGFAESAVATVGSHRDKITAENPFPTKGVESVRQLLKQPGRRLMPSPLSSALVKRRLLW